MQLTGEGKRKGKTTYVNVEQERGKNRGKGIGTSAFYPVTWGDCPPTTPGGKGWEPPHSILFHGEPVHRLHWVERDGNFRILSCFLSTDYTGWKGMGTSAFYPVPCPQTTTGGKGWELPRSILFEGGDCP